jgi:hypothetical protein
MSTATDEPQRLAAPLQRYLTALVVRSARVAEVPLSVYCARVEAALRSVRRERP